MIVEPGGIMTKVTATQRIERAVEKALKCASGNREALPIGEVRDLMRQSILMERTRLKRGVRNLQAFPCLDIATQAEYLAVKLDEILKQWEAGHE